MKFAVFLNRDGTYVVSVVEIRTPWGARGWSTALLNGLERAEVESWASCGVLKSFACVVLRRDTLNDSVERCL